MKTTIIGYPRIGDLRELKFASEKYFRKEITADELERTAKEIRQHDLAIQKSSGLDYIPSNDFSYYDGVLDTAFLLGAVPERYTSLGLSELDTYFAAARGYQGDKGDVRALAMKKWFNTNYHYIVPEIDDETEIKLNGSKPFDLFSEALESGVKTKPVIIGAYTFLKLARYKGSKKAEDFAEQAAKAYTELLEKLAALGAEWVQLDEPSLVTDMTAEDISLFKSIYEKILADKHGVKVLVQTYFGDVRDCYSELCALDFDGIGLDFVEGKESLNLISKYGFPTGTVLFAGVVNGKNIWRNNYAGTLDIIAKLRGFTDDIVLGTSCSLLHVPCTLDNESKLSADIKKHFAYAAEKLTELAELKKLVLAEKPEETAEFVRNAALHSGSRIEGNEAVRQKVASLGEKDFTRLPEFAEREKIQKERFKLPLFPTTTIGSFPQTKEVKANRAARRKGEITQAEYEQFIEKKIAECVSLQEEIGLDVLVHGEYERNDMVEYFGECLDGYIFTEKAWVQSYGTRCVKPPVIWGDISRARPMTVRWSKYAQSLTNKPMKGMLTGPVTILNWSFPREDITLKESAFQIAHAIREEVLDLEANGISIIQVDEAALREKLPLRRADWHKDYLDWAIPAFRYVHSGVKPQTQIHTHMCYSEFADIIKDIDDMDADVITFEASRSDLTILDVLKENSFRTEVGPGVYDIHSPRVPSKDEIKTAVNKMLGRISADKLWINPDCGLKTRGTEETVPSLENLVAAAKEVRNENS
ncbi:5-methyltetrahydropteroyltriglutamate--homocysteine S-methyltransferase [Ruminococcus sp. NK3A76]|uniref:5-methyltetrahydropteroyltriglutamate-- homocysteine S-methyltransferase n=1 Tax=Ruminococcus sp. NK3A76 TaxID=877411 RepID=UPI00048F9456|nr:5-methyltetrahydropteroyltriglutamate--homocysteine S-methyltransferase [Ruminococcus sp. NK3A76]